MSRTSIEIDDDLIFRVMRRYDLRTKREAVQFALRELDVEPMSKRDLLSLEGSGWIGDIGEMRGQPREG